MSAVHKDLISDDPPKRPATPLGSFEDFTGAWLKCLRAVIEDGHDTQDGDRRIRELLNVSFSARSVDLQLLLAAGAQHERITLMLEKYSSLSVLPQYSMCYGKLFHEHEGVDQIQWLVERLNKNPFTKSATIGFHLPGDTELSCISLMDCKARSGLLFTNIVYRSQNVYSSQPGNFLAMTQLHRDIAARTNTQPGPITLHVLSAHVYGEDFDAVADVLAGSGASHAIAEETQP